MQEGRTTRRNFMKSGAAAGALLGTSTADAQVGSNAKLPEIKNILFIMVDQQRQDSLGCYGNDIVQTPNIDRLARTGIRFNNVFTPSPVCTPARTSLQTGLWPHTHGLIMNTSRCFYNGGEKDPAPDQRFFSEDLKDKGWNLAHIGKWHIGTEINKPVDHGYDDLTFFPDYGYPGKKSIIWHTWNRLVSMAFRSERKSAILPGHAVMPPSRKGLRKPRYPRTLPGRRSM